MRTLRHRMARDRVVLLAALAGTTAIGWLVLEHTGAGLTRAGVPTMAATAMSDTGARGAGFGLAFAMWAVMMVAMMAPAAWPSAAAYLALARRARPERSPLAATANFLGGYLGAWLGYAALGAAAQSMLVRAVLLTPMGAIASNTSAAVVLIVAGAYQLTPLKRTCVTHCRSPLLQLMGAWRDGKAGALRLGLVHGSWCVACCWALMALMFVAGVMNLGWMAIVALFILAEKLVPAHWHVDLVSGTLLIGAGVWMALLVAG